MTQSSLEQEPIANAAWSRMLQGDRRFTEGRPGHPWQDKETRQTLLDDQSPDAAVLSCSDLRVPPEVIFNQGLDDLFTVCTAGQLIDSAVIAPLGYTVKKLHVSLICVLGHEHCGTTKAAEQEPGDLMYIITSEADDSLETADVMDGLDERIAVAKSIVLRQTGMSIWQAREAELDVREDTEHVHIAHIIEILVEQPPVIQQALTADELMIVGVRYQLGSGKVGVLSF